MCDCVLGRTESQDVTFHSHRGRLSLLRHSPAAPVPGPCPLPGALSLSAIPPAGEAFRRRRWQCRWEEGSGEVRDAELRGQCPSVEPGGPAHLSQLPHRLCAPAQL